MLKKPKILVASVIAVVSVTSMMFVVPAFATDEFYPHPGTLEGCGKCAQTSGPNNYIKNNEAYNYSGEGLCNAAYLLNSKGEYPVVFEGCYSSGHGNILCYAGEFYGHGQARRYYAKYEYNLIGRQDNFTGCE